MLFTTPLFFFIYLPLVLAGFLGIGRYSTAWAATWLFLASLVFYGYWMPEFTLLLLTSIICNYSLGKKISQCDPVHGTPEKHRRAKRWLILGITLNLLALAYFKYAGFLVGNLNGLFGQHWDIGKIILPIGISFFTFTQIAFLADTYQKGTREYAFSHYGLFVTYFPHLIAGPVLHHAQMMPQFRLPQTYRPNLANLAGGLCIFCIGLAKKIVLADGVAPYADAVFDGVAAGLTPDALEVWIAAVAYTLQLYFDFSGYSDMAIGLSWMFNIRLPYNFASPYQASNIVEFWRRWHMTLSAFLRDYLYIPLGGNQRGPLFRHMNLLVTMLLGGLWHGANWTFVVWGGLHGLFLIANHAFQGLPSASFARIRNTAAFRLLGWAITFLAVIFAWIFFRASDLTTALRMIVVLPDIASSGYFHNGFLPLLENHGLDIGRGFFWLSALLAIALLFPNSNRIGEYLLQRYQFHSRLTAIALGAALFYCTLLVVINGARDAVSAFIYFNF